MTETALTLGPIVFQDFEIPSAISFGGRQRMAVRYLTTGQRVTDLLGPDDATISFSGVLSGPYASARAREIDTLRALGQPLELAWNSFFYSVVIRNFKAEFRNQWWITYKLQCTVIENASLTAVGSALSAAGDALAALNFMYDTAPSALLPIPDVRSMLTFDLTSGRPLQVARVTSELQSSTVKLAAQQILRESSFVRGALHGGLPLPLFITAFTDMINDAAALQFLSLSQNCLGQAAVFLMREETP